MKDEDVRHLSQLEGEELLKKQHEILLSKYEIMRNNMYRIHKAPIRFALKRIYLKLIKRG